MNNEELKKIILDNEGITLDKYKNKSTLKSGYYVSIYGAEVQTSNIDEALEEVNKKAEYLQRLGIKSLFVGVWYYEGIYYVDITKHIKDKTTAIEYGKEQKQISIYNIKDNKSIKLNYKNIKYYTIYKIIKNDLELVKQFDTIDEVGEFLNISKKRVYHLINNDEVFSSYYKIYCDIISELELIKSRPTLEKC